MKNAMRLCLLLLLFINLGSIFAKAQIADRVFQENFAFSVQSIDDFFERFNFSKGTNFQKYCAERFPDVQVSRKIFVESLFDFEAKEKFDVEHILEFELQIMQKDSPAFLSYSDNNWFAEVDCRFLMQGKPQDLTLILMVERSENDSYSWFIVGANGKILDFKSTKEDSLILTTENLCTFEQEFNSSQYFLSPVSHALEFSGINSVFENTPHIAEYIYARNPSFELKKMVFLSLSKKLKFSYVKRINYHLLQLDGWIIQLNRFTRPQKNSGWLISNLIKVGPNEKLNYLTNRLNISY